MYRERARGVLTKLVAATDGVVCAALPRSPLLWRMQPLAAIVPPAVKWHPLASGDRLPFCFACRNLLVHLQILRAVQLVYLAL